MISLPERAPDALLADKGYDADAIRADLVERNIEAVISGRSNRRVKIQYDRALYKQRNRIGRMFGQLKINHAIATRYDQLANSLRNAPSRNSQILAQICPRRLSGTTPMRISRLCPTILSGRMGGIAA